jgi:hypothetical protein
MALKSFMELANQESIENLKQIQNNLAIIIKSKE